jgi:SAM-dependent methyltransferase
MEGARSNQDVYSSSEFERWSTARGLSAPERWLVDRYLSREGDTLEAGAGGGRILFALRDMGFTSLAGFDVVPGMVESARAADASHGIRFEVQDAVDLGDASETYDQVIYLNQFICFVDTEEGRIAAVREAHRVLRAGGVALFSFLRWEGRQSQLFARAITKWVQILRRVRGSERHEHDMPWLRLAGRPNVGALLDRDPHIHWFTKQEAETLLERAGFKIRFSGLDVTAESIARGEDPIQDLRNDRQAIHMFFVASKG